MFPTQELVSALPAASKNVLGHIVHLDSLMASHVTYTWAVVTESMLDMQVKRLVQTAYERAKSVLKQHDKDLHTLAKALLERETMSGTQIKELLGIKSQTTVAVTGTEVVAAPASRNVHDSDLQ